MTRKTRLLLFLSLALGFIVAAPSAIIYSQGYRLDFEGLRLVQTGSFYFRITPRNAIITISREGKNIPLIQKDTNFLFGTAYITNMLPGNYNLVVSKEGYHPWEKRVGIREKRVTEMRNIVLIPLNPGLTAVSENTSNLFPILGNPKIAIKELTDDGGWNLFLHDPVRNSSTTLISSEEVSGKPMEVKSLSRKRELLINMGQYYLVVDLTNGIQYQIRGVVSPLLDPVRPNSVIHLKDGALVSYDYINKIALVLASDVKAFSIRENGNIVWLSTSGLLFENGVLIRNRNFPVKNDADYRIFLPNQSEIMIAENDTFHLLDRSTSPFREVFRSDREPVVSPNRRKVAHFNNHEIQILYLDNIIDQPAKSYGENSFLTRFSGTIGNVNWLTNHYIIFTVGDEIKVSEIDERGNVNIVNLARMPNPNIHFEGANKKLYLVSEGNLFVSDVLIR